MITSDCTDIDLAETFRFDTAEWRISNRKWNYEDRDIVLSFRAKTARRDEHYPHYQLGVKHVDVNLILSEEQWNSLLDRIVEELFFNDDISVLTDRIAKLERDNPL